MMTNINFYQHLQRNLIYLMVTCPDIGYVFSILSHFMWELCMVQWDGALRVLEYINHAFDNGFINQCHYHLCIEAYNDGSYVER